MGSYVLHLFKATLGWILLAVSPLTSLSSVYNPKMGAGDSIHISFYRSAGDRSLSSGASMCGIMSKLRGEMGKNEGSMVNRQG